MIVLIAPETDIENEIEILNQLFEAGLEYYHFRKPTKDYAEHSAYLQQIDARYHKNIVVHYHHELVNDFGLKGIHLQEQHRIDLLDNIASYISTYREKGIETVSSSFHDPEVLKNCKTEFHYHLLSPVFSSISKKGYEGKGFTVGHIPKKIIGMGGVNKGNLSEIEKMGYHGVGVLGGIWNSKTPVADFKAMFNYYQK